uniref:Uncharacterized protein n=1 Tax=Oryza punctata TaxID=4537 RepID=A0A0E0LP19_ORYPU
MAEPPHAASSSIPKPLLRHHPHRCCSLAVEIDGRLRGGGSDSEVTGRLFRLHCPQPVPPRRPGTQSPSATPPPPTPRCSSALFSFLGWPTGVAPHPRLHCTLHHHTAFIIHVVGVVSLPKEPLKSATQQVEIHVRKIYCSN